MVTAYAPIKTYSPFDLYSFPQNHVPKPALQSPRATTTEACAPRAHAPQQEKPLQWEAHALQRRVAPRSPQLEKAHTQQWRPNAAKKIK